MCLFCIWEAVMKEYSYYSNKEPLTLCVELCSVFRESFEEHLLPQQLQEGREGGRCLLVVVHLLLCTLARTTQQNTHFVLVTQLQRAWTHRTKTSR